MEEKLWGAEQEDFAGLLRIVEQLRRVAPGKLPADVDPDQTANLIEELGARRAELKQTYDALAVANEELAVANQELATANGRMADARDRYADLYDSSPVGYATLAGSGLILEANRKLASMLGLELEKMIRRPFAELVVEEDRDDFHRCLRSVLANPRGGQKTLESRLRAAPGHELWVRSDWLLIEETAQSRGGRLRISVADITDYKRAQAQLAQADRMASVGLLAASVAHEINNPLTYVLYNLTCVTEGLPKLHAAMRPNAGAALEDLRVLATSAMDGARRIHDIVKPLRVFSRPDVERTELTDIHSVIDAAIEMAFNQLKYRARLVKRYGDLPEVEANAGQLCQVFLNLLVNATHAIEEGDVDHNQVRIRTRQHGGYVNLEFEDTGNGIPPESLSRVFEPFFTTKEVGTGSGLGLSICQKIIHDHGGDISIESTAGRGTCLTIQLPVAAAKVADPTEVVAPASEPTASGRVLVIDDEPAICEMVSSILEQHEVAVADSGIAAQEILKRDSDFDVILCDVMMPDQNGVDFHHWLVDEHPKLTERVLFMTGGVCTPRAHRLLQDLSNLRLQKPFEPKQLRAIVQKMILHGGSGSAASTCDLAPSERVP